MSLLGLSPLIYEQQFNSAFSKETVEEVISPSPTPPIASITVASGT